MMRLLFFIALLSGHFSFAQNDAFILKSKVKNDTVLMRWAPANADLMMTGLRNGYVVQRIPGDGVFENNASLTEFTILPFENRKAGYEYSPNEDVRNMSEFLSDLLASNSVSADSKKMTFAVLMLGSSTNREIAELLGLFYEDITAGTGTYTYRILLKNTAAKSNHIDINTGQLTADKTMTQLTGSSQTNLKQTYLSWEAASLQADYVAYWVERSTDSVHFEKRNSLPYFFFKSQDETTKINCDFADTNVLEGQTYFYRITGLDHFAENGKSSNTVKVYIPKSIYGEIHLDSIRAKGFERIIHGEFIPYRSQNEIEKWVLMRSDSLLSGYTFLAEKPHSTNQFEFTATVPIESGDRYYYKVLAVGTDYDTISSFPTYFFTLDQIPPAAPINLAGKINDSGIVTLNWEPNAEADIRGYRVYRSNALFEEFTEVSRVFCTASFFTDTLPLRNLTNDIYYSVSAVDLNYNNSETCTPVKLQKPDILAPVPAIFTGYEMNAEGLVLSWNNSSSADINKQVLLRQINQETDTLLYWSDTTAHFTDTSGTPGNSYYYSIISIDYSANAAISEKLYANYETGVRKGIENLVILANRVEKQIELSWEIPAGEIYSVQIYRAKNDSTFILYKTLRGSELTSFSDQNLSLNNTYHYKIKVIYKSGISSVLSDAVTIVY